MSKNSKISRKGRAKLAVLFFIPPLILLLTYLGIGFKYPNAGRNDKVDILMENLPGWIQSFSILMIISILFCVISVYWTSKSKTKKLDVIRVVMLTTAFLAIFTILVNIALLL